MDEVDSCGSHMPVVCSVEEMFLHEDLRDPECQTDVHGIGECMLIETAAEKPFMPPEEATEELLGIGNRCAMLHDGQEAVGSQTIPEIGNECLSLEDAVKCNSSLSLESCLKDKDWVVGETACEMESKTSHGTPDHNMCDKTLLDHVPHLHGGDYTCQDLEFGGTDETDQGQIVPTLNLTENHLEYFPEVTKSQYYADPPTAFSETKSRISPSDNSKATTVTESSGLTANGNLQTETSGTHMVEPSCLPSCAISQSSTATAQEHSQAQQPSISSAEPRMQSGDLKRKTVPEKGQDDQAILKRQKVSPANHSEVQNNQTISMPREFSVSGSSNCIIDSPNNCIINYQKCGLCSNPKQHAIEWAGLCTQTDSPTAKAPVQALETIAKLIAQTTDWKKLARRLPMTECGKLEADIKTLESCQGTTSDKTSAVLLRWWRGHPEQLDLTAMKTRLRDGLESCSLIRLARTLDRYL